MEATMPATRERRSDVRLLRGTRVEAALVDRYDQPVAMLRDAQVIDVSAEGLAVMSATRARPGSVLHIATAGDGAWLPGQSHCKARVINCLASGAGAYTLHCALSEGLMPASLIYNWAA